MMKTCNALLLPLLALTAACGGSAGDTGTGDAVQTQAPQQSVLPPTQEILRKTYDTSYHVPDDFFVDERAATEVRSYTVHHVLDSTRSFELCSDDLLEAQAWEEADNLSRAVQGYFVTSIETDRYFEFVRELAYDQDIGNVDDITSPGYARVFKCGYVERTGVDRSAVDGYSGRLQAAPGSPASLRDFTEYLWQFRYFDVTRKLVLDTWSTSDESRPQHSLLYRSARQSGQRSLRSNRCHRVAFQSRSVVRTGRTTLRHRYFARNRAGRRCRAALPVLNLACARSLIP